MRLSFGSSMRADQVFARLRNSNFMLSRGYEIFYASKYTLLKNGVDAYGICYKEGGKGTAYVHVRIMGHSMVSSLEYQVIGNTNRIIENDMLTLVNALK